MIPCHMGGEVKPVGKVKRQLIHGMRAQETRDSQNAILEKAGSLQQHAELKVGDLLKALSNPEPAGL